MLKPLNPMLSPLPGEEEAAEETYALLKERPHTYEELTPKQRLGLTSLHCRGLLKAPSPYGNAPYELL